MVAEFLQEDCKLALSGTEWVGGVSDTGWRPGSGSIRNLVQPKLQWIMWWPIGHSKGEGDVPPPALKAWKSSSA